MNLASLKIGVVGMGTVGRATARCWLEHCAEVRTYDQFAERRTHSLDAVLMSDVVFVCLPEAEVDEFFKACAADQQGQQANYVLRSTVPIGTTRRLAKDHGLTNLVHSPEFLTERCALIDAQMPARNIIGEPGRPLNASEGYVTTWRGLYLDKLYRTRFPTVPVHAMSSDESEAVKLFTNATFAATVSLWNEFRALVDALGLDWEAVRAGVLADGRISPSHTQVPGPDGLRGFGGRCLPKDLRQLLQCFAEADTSAPILRSVMARNEVDRTRRQS